MIDHLPSLLVQQHSNTMTPAVNGASNGEQQQQQQGTGPPQTTMGPQSQHRVSLAKRTHLMQANNSGNRKKKQKSSVQQTLHGNRAFDPLKDCIVCKHKLAGRNVHRAHHKLCWNNRRTKGVTSSVTLEGMAEEKRLAKLFAAAPTEQST